MLGGAALTWGVSRAVVAPHGVLLLRRRGSDYFVSLRRPDARLPIAGRVSTACLTWGYVYEPGPFAGEPTRSRVDSHVRVCLDLALATGERVAVIQDLAPWQDTPAGIAYGPHDESAYTHVIVSAVEWDRVAAVLSPPGTV